MAYWHYRLGIGAVVAIGAIGFQVARRDSRGEDVRHDAHELVAHCSLYLQNREYMDSLCDTSHEGAFKHAYTMGSRYRSASFDRELYAEELLDGMIHQANADGSTHIGADLGKLRQDVVAGKQHLLSREWEH